MIATLSAQLPRMSSTPDSTLHNANSAGAPLPLIPRRTASASRSQSGFRTLTPSSSPVKITLQQASPPPPPNKLNSSPASDSDESSSSTAHIAPEIPKKQRLLRPKRDRAARSVPLHLPDLVSPVPDLPRDQEDTKDRYTSINVVRNTTESTDMSASSASSMASSSSQPLIHIPGTPLKLTLEKLKLSTSPTKTSTQADMGGLVKSAGAVFPPIPPVIRKKSGQLVKSSLKASKPVVRGGLSVVTGAVASKSEPATPKAVHFDAHLEHVKLFLAEQKPLAVSRDTSPDGDTSGTESDFPPFIFGEPSDDQKRKKLTMQVVNMPTLVDQKADVALLELKLASDTTSIVGKVRVRNISFHKWVAVRFTFDAWQTTSEVTGKYVQSVENFDIFSFSIKLDDLMARIDGKTLILAVRYSVSGQEFWDNNRGQNYLATFVKTNIPPEKPPTSTAPSADASIADLHDRLEKVMRGRERDRVGNPGSGKKKERDSLSSRYDFTSSLKEPPFSPTFLGQPRSHVRTRSSPADPPTRKSSSLSPPPSLARSFVHKTMVQPRVTLGSPRDLDNETFRPAPFVPSDLDDPPFPVPPVTRVARNHQRGYFDLEVPPRSSVRRTAFGSPHDAKAAQMPFHSSPSFEALGIGLTPRDAASADSGSDLSTPSILSPSASSGSSSTSPSPTEGFILSGLMRESPVDDGASYNQFLDKFCFYTGNQTSSPRKPSLDVLSPLTTPVSPLASAGDDTSVASGTSTPTGPSLYFDIPEISTPVML